MDLRRLLEHFEGLTPEDQMEFMTSVGPAFCQSVLADPARRRQMMARCMVTRCHLLGELLRRAEAARAVGRGLKEGLRAAAVQLAETVPRASSS